MSEAYPDEHWEMVATAYRTAATAPALAIADQFHVPLATARRWIGQARTQGKIPKTSHGRTSEEHDRITRIAADLGVERHDLARVILRHIPSGKIYVKQRDADPPRRPANGDVAASFGHLIRESRTARAWTQADLATRLGEALGQDVKPLTITRIELGKRPVPLGEVVALASLLHLSLDALVKTRRDGDGQ